MVSAVVTVTYLHLAEYVRSRRWWHFAAWVLYPLLLIDVTFGVAFPAWLELAIVGASLPVTVKLLRIRQSEGVNVVVNEESRGGT